jgi:hypothetical protein
MHASTMGACAETAVLRSCAQSMWQPACGLPVLIKEHPASAHLWSTACKHLQTQLPVKPSANLNPQPTQTPCRSSLLCLHVAPAISLCWNYIVCQPSCLLLLAKAGASWFWRTHGHTKACSRIRCVTQLLHEVVITTAHQQPPSSDHAPCSPPSL